MPPIVDPTLLPYLTGDITPIAGRVRDRPEDFRVTEVPAYEPSGEGDHVLVRFRKAGLTTPQAVDRLAREVGADPRQAGWAGLKDRHAVTEQWASLFGTTPEAVLAAEVDGVAVLAAARHPHKLRTGHLRANVFELVVRGVPAERLGDLEEILGRLAAHGLPNAFGEQRFGRDGDNVARARRWLVEGGRAPRGRFERKLLVSALQADVFNRALAARMREGLLDRPVPGDLMKREDSGGLFVAPDPAEVAPRLARFEVSPTGPIVGPKMRWPEGEARAREEAAMAEARVPAEVLGRLGRSGPGSRRPYRVKVIEPSAEPRGDGVALRFTLPRGAYATALLREILKQDA